MPEFTRVLPVVDATLAMAQAIASILRGGDCLTLTGDLGAGKTTFLRGLASNLKANVAMVSSPTFVLVNQYPLAPDTPALGAQELVHADAYRLRSGEDLEALGWDRFIQVDAHGHVQVRPTLILAVEWPGKLGGLSALPPEDTLLALQLEHGSSPTERLMTLRVPQVWTTRPRVQELIDNPPKKCPIKGRWVAPTTKNWPFFDEQAKLADLDRWFTGQYTISRELKEDDLET